jgi:hypothetical protein
MHFGYNTQYWWEQIVDLNIPMNGNDNSQFFLDIFSWTHVLCGAIIYLITSRFFSADISFITVAVFATVFELLENTRPWILQYNYIDKDGHFTESDGKKITKKINNIIFYFKIHNDDAVNMISQNNKIIISQTFDDLRAKDISIYLGDSLINSVGDVIADLAGAFIVYYLLGLDEKYGIFYAFIFILIICVIAFYFIPESYSYFITYISGIKNKYFTN